MTVIPVVHAVTNDEIILGGAFLENARIIAATLGPRGAMHLRARWINSRQFFAVAKELAKIADTTGCLFIVNDRVDMACAVDAPAVQLTSRSMNIEDARKVRPRLLIGASVHSRADIAAVGAADWLVAGPAYETASHPGQSPGGPALIADIARETRIPLIAIGGVTPERVTALRAAGAYGIAAISGMWQSENVAAAAHNYLSAHDAYEGFV